MSKPVHDCIGEFLRGPVVLQKNEDEIACKRARTLFSRICHCLHRAKEAIREQFEFNRDNGFSSTQSKTDFLVAPGTLAEALVEKPR